MEQDSSCHLYLYSQCKVQNAKCSSVLLSTSVASCHQILLSLGSAKHMMDWLTAACTCGIFPQESERLKTNDGQTWQQDAMRERGSSGWMALGVCKYGVARGSDHSEHFAYTHPTSRLISIARGQGDQDTVTRCKSITCSFRIKVPHRMTLRNGEV